MRADRRTGARRTHYVVVAHVPLAALADETSELAGELERDGLISSETVRRIACDATVAIAVDDDVGHTMYEGRARRFPTDAQRREIMRRDRHCRFPAVHQRDVHQCAPPKTVGHRAAQPTCTTWFYFANFTITASHSRDGPRPVTPIGS